VFYNAAMRLDRDLNVAVVHALFPDADRSLAGWDVLAATGVRGLRLLRETGRFGSLRFTERDPEAFQVLSKNADAYAAQGALARAGDARGLSEPCAFDYVDLDPFGTPMPYLDAVLAAVRPGGIIGVTATDLPVLAGVSRGVCETRYGARPIRGDRAPESAIRIVIAAVARRAGALGRRVEPVLAYAHDHYVRMYGRVGSGAIADGPRIRIIEWSAWEGPPLPRGGPYGPLWLGSLFEPKTVDRLEVPRSAESPRELARLLERFRDESRVDVPFYYEPNRLAEALALPEPPALGPLLQAIESQGFPAARSHVRPSAFRTTAPRALVEASARSVAPTSASARARSG
jgi:tRNA (guanine26-N2/guanine27-N2)-dimethyltransferase